MKKISLFLSIFLLVGFACCFSACENKSESTVYTIDCTLSNDMVLTGSVNIDYFNSTETSLKELKFNLFGNAFRENAKYKPIAAQYTSQAYPYGLSYGNLTVKNVSSNGQNLEYLVCGTDKNILCVTLDKEIFPEERVKVQIDYTLTLAKVIARTGYNEQTVNLANFYPVLCGYSGGFYECEYYSIGDPFFSECADYYVNITLNSDYVVASSGILNKSSVSGDMTTLCYSLKSARDFAFVLSKNFEVITQNVNGVSVNYYYYDDETPENSLTYAVKAVQTFSSLFGGYAYSKYSVTQTKFVQGGMEYPALVMISDTLEEKAYGEVIVHETAHQWWQTAVGNNEVEHAFLDEGLAEYSVVLFYENRPEYEYTRKTLIESSLKTYEIFCTVYDKLFGGVNTTMARALKEYTSEYEYVNVTYVKGCLMFDYLRQTIGDKKFFDGLSRYYSNYKYKIAEPEDLISCFEKEGADAEGFFDGFINGKVIL